MYHQMYGSWGSGWDWLWMTFVVLFWLAVIAGVVYAVVRLAVSHEHQHQNQNQPPPQ